MSCGTVGSLKHQEQTGQNDLCFIIVNDITYSFRKRKDARATRLP